MEQLINKSTENNFQSELFTITKFNNDYLERISPTLIDKIVEFDMKNNKVQTVYDIIIPFIQRHSYQWNGLILNFRYQKRYFPQKLFNSLAQSIERMQNLECLCLSFGGQYVSEYYAENNQDAFDEWEKTTNGLSIFYDSYKILLDQFLYLVSVSPNLKRVCLDFQGLSQDCIQMLPQLTKINNELGQCKQLEEYILSLNHCEIYENEDKTLSEFLNSFSFLKDLKQLQKFVLNIIGWELSYENFQILGRIISEYLTYNKDNFEEFQLDHTSLTEITRSNQDAEKLTEIQILTQNFKKLLEYHQKTLKKFYLSLSNYICYDSEINEFSSIFNSLFKCRMLEKLSLRVQQWNCFNSLVEKKFYKSLSQIQYINTLKLFHLSTFRSSNGPLSPYFQYAARLLEQLGKKRLVMNKQLPQQKIISNHVKKYYRKDILLHIHHLINDEDIPVYNPSFVITYYI